jgi:hypothetical protein
MREDNIRDIRDRGIHPHVDDTVDGATMRGDGVRDGTMDRMTVPEAAELLKITQSAVRKRIQRGTIRWDKDDEGRIYVYVNSSETGLDTGEDKSLDIRHGRSRDELLEAYRDQVEFLRRELERKDTLLMSLMQRVPELEGSIEPREAPETIAGDTDRGEDVAPEPQKPSQRRSWWRRFFGFE